MCIYILAKSDEYGNLDTVTPFASFEGAKAAMEEDYLECTRYDDYDQDTVCHNKEYFSLVDNSGARVWDEIFEVEVPKELRYCPYCGREIDYCI